MLELGRPYKWKCVGRKGVHAQGCKKEGCTLMDPKDDGLFFTEACAATLPDAVKERLVGCEVGP